MTFKLTEYTGTNQSNLEALEIFKQRGYHPDTRRRLTDSDKKNTPWLFPDIAQPADQNGSADRTGSLFELNRANPPRVTVEDLEDEEL